MGAELGNALMEAIGVFAQNVVRREVFLLATTTRDDSGTHGQTTISANGDFHVCNLHRKGEAVRPRILPYLCENSMKLKEEPRKCPVSAERNRNKYIFGVAAVPKTLTG
jgi:hypothetical protein